MRNNRMQLLVALHGFLGFVAALLAFDPSLRPPQAETRVVYELATLPPAEAEGLQDGWGYYRVRLNSAVSEVGDYAVAEVVVAGANDLGTVWLPTGDAPDETMTVRARLAVVRHPAAVGKAGFTEYRLVDAVRAAP
jgi:hypothetical protein